MIFQRRKCQERGLLDQSKLSDEALEWDNSDASLDMIGRIVDRNARMGCEAGECGNRIRLER